eukprot:Awhi_evm1s1109
MESQADYQKELYAMLEQIPPSELVKLNNITNEKELLDKVAELSLEFKQKKKDIPKTTTSSRTKTKENLSTSTSSTSVSSSPSSFTSSPSSSSTTKTKENLSSSTSSTSVSSSPSSFTSSPSSSSTLTASSYSQAKQTTKIDSGETDCIPKKEDNFSSLSDDILLLVVNRYCPSTLLEEYKKLSRIAQNRFLYIFRKSFQEMILSIVSSKMLDDGGDIITEETEKTELLAIVTLPILRKIAFELDRKNETKLYAQETDVCLSLLAFKNMFSYLSCWGALQPPEYLLMRHDYYCKNINEEASRKPTNQAPDSKKTVGASPTFDNHKKDLFKDSTSMPIASLALFTIYPRKFISGTLAVDPLLSNNGIITFIRSSTDGKTIVQIGIYNHGLTSKEIDSKFRRGTKMSLLEPFLTLHSDGNRGISVNISDVFL